MQACLSSCDAVLLEQRGYRKYLGPPDSVSTDIIGALTKIRKAKMKFDEEGDALMENPQMPAMYSNHPGLVKLFLLMHPIRQAASSTKALLVKVNEMQEWHRGWRIYLPSYPFIKSLQRTNVQVGHDCGGLIAGDFVNSQKSLDRMMHHLRKSKYQPTPR
jgi:hypothetical protein